MILYAGSCRCHMNTSNMSTLTADQWKDWVLEYTQCLQYIAYSILPPEHVKICGYMLIAITKRF